MRAWFIRCNGETAHNQPGTSSYVPGEPPRFPDRKFNYRDDCLNGGFARVGWPAAGDLRDPSWPARARAAYKYTIKSHHIRFLERFVAIEPGDIVILPTYRRPYEVYLGIVIPPRRGSGPAGSHGAYYYHFDIAAGDWYDNAHRVDVEWRRDPSGVFDTFDIPEIGGTWRRGFGEIKAGRQRVVQLAMRRSAHG